jgi:hypothetical protein
MLALPINVREKRGLVRIIAENPHTSGKWKRKLTFVVYG